MSPYRWGRLREEFQLNYGKMILEGKVKSDSDERTTCEGRKE